MDPHEAQGGQGGLHGASPAQGTRPAGKRRQLLLSSERQAAGCCPGSRRWGSIAHRDPINGRNCFVKYQTLVARPDIGNRFICAAGRWLLFPAPPFPPAAENGLGRAGKTPTPSPGVGLSPPNCCRGLSRPRLVPPHPRARGQAAMLWARAPGEVAPGPAEQHWSRSTVYSLFNYNPNCNTAVKRPSQDGIGNVYVPPASASGTGTQPYKNRKLGIFIYILYI